MRQFQKELEAINSAIVSFNKHLASDFHVPEFNKDNAIEQKHIIEIVHGNWNAFPFPNNGTRGVYFVFGHEKIQIEKNGLYIGKSSFGQKTSNRLWAHLSPYKTEKYFIWNGYHGEIYILDYIASIDLDKLGIPFMAPALEEYLISTLKDPLNLLNGTGNSKARGSRT